MAEARNVRQQIEERERTLLGPDACLAVNTRGRQRPEEECESRTCFQRDVDRIVHSKSFRRLMHKTQVFLAPEGDHYRTRMTHTVEVMRIARTIARGLALNEDLTEAAAFGHDLGHTPFGHAGERALNEIAPGGFRHNEQSIRVVELLEKNGEGLNLTWEVRNGILCHTGDTPAETLEGRIIHLADQIAYINHDIDDAMRAQIIFPMDIPLHLLQGLGFSHSQRINTLTADVIAASTDSHTIRQSPERKEQMAQLREFMFEAVYRNPVAKGQESKAQDLIKYLFDYYCRNPDALPGDFQDIRYRESVERAACDYIAGMTDNFAVEVFSDLTLPKAWTVK
ncbi:MAG: deoxyguanosinetriphosphate triphosphohydrolase [Oscillospiraceae bacterium]|nr:deoxyguanosinetriphosphate triphosphohydrolase [Oscillospiraceae bacterium]